MRKSIESKVSKIKDLVKEINNFKSIALINLEGLQSKNLQKLRHEFKDKIKFSISTRNNILRALSDCGKPGLESLGTKIKGSCCLGLTNEDPFKLSILIRDKRTPAPAKPGQAAPSDIIVRAGPTPFAPGPVMADLGAVGIKTKVEAGKLSVIADTVVVKEGQVIKSNQAAILSKLGITPMFTGLNLIAVYDKGRVYDINELVINADLYKSKVSIALNPNLTTHELVKALIQFAYTQAVNLGVNACIITKDIAGRLLSKGSAEAQALASKINWR